MVALPTWQLIFVMGSISLAVLLSIVHDRLAFNRLRRQLDATIEQMDRDMAEFRLRFGRAPGS